jgi:hypothetical protein
MTTTKTVETFDSLGQLACGCLVSVGQMQWCATHAAAKEMAAIIRDIYIRREGEGWFYRTGKCADHLAEAVVLIVRMEDQR